MNQFPAITLSSNLISTQIEMISQSKRHTAEHKGKENADETQWGSYHRTRDETLQLTIEL